MNPKDKTDHKELICLPRKHIALVAHDHKKQELFEWIEWNRELLSHHTLYATGTTGKYIEENLHLPIEKLESGPLGGDLQIGALISQNAIDVLIFFWDPLEPMPHDPDIKALLRISVVWNIPVACNRATADFIVSSPLFGDNYTRLIDDYTSYKSRKI